MQFLQFFQTKKAFFEGGIFIVKKRQHINWHKAFLSGLKIELTPRNSILEWHSEFILNKGHRRLDSLIIKSPGSPPIVSPIACIFRQYNALDYKGPDESMTVSNYLKALSYVYSIPGYLNNPSAVNEITLTLVTHRFPRKLSHYLAENLQQSVDKVLQKAGNGIYYMYNYLIPVQLIVLSQLSPDEYLWLSCLTKNITSRTPLKHLRKAYEPHQDDPLYKTIMNAIIRGNMREKGEAMMCEALYELFADEMSKREALGKSLGRQEGIQEGIQKMGQVISRLLEDNRSSEIARATSDPTYCQMLMKEYQI